MLLLSGLGGFVTALVLCFVYLKLKPKDLHTAALDNFRRQHLFEYELALSKKQFEEVKISLEKEIVSPENQPIKSEIEILRELIEAADLITNFGKYWNGSENIEEVRIEEVKDWSRIEQDMQSMGLFATRRLWCFSGGFGKAKKEEGEITKKKK